MTIAETHKIDASGADRPHCGPKAVTINGSAVKDNNELRNEIAALQPGTSVQLTVQRDGKERTVTAKLGELEGTAGRTTPGSSSEESGRFGLSVEPLTQERARALNVRASKGLVVQSVEPGSRAASAGLQAGDVIEQVDRKPVATGEELRSALTSGDRPAVLLVHRGQTSIFVTLERQ